MSESVSEAQTRLAQLSDRQWTSRLSECYAVLDPSSPADYRTLATLLASEWSSNVPKCVGLGGGQGAGKSTLSHLIESACAHFGIRACFLSLDDFYFDRARRRELAADVHPLFETRGPPGTHDISRCHEAMVRLQRAGVIELPIFDKGLDEQSGQRSVHGPFDLVLLEGWCVAASPVDEAALEAPINELERVRDPDATWRRYVNACLGESYATTWEKLEYLVYLQAPGLAAIRRWRLHQENDRPEHQRLDAEAVDAFVQYFERITLSMMDTQPRFADGVVGLSDDHSIASLDFCSG